MDVKQQINEWSKLYGKPISEENYKEICSNLKGFFSVLKAFDDEGNINKGENNKLLTHF